MAVMELLSRIKHDFGFSKDEVVGFLISAAVFGFIYAFRRFTLGELLSAVAFVLVSIVIHVSVQKIVGLHYGVKVEYRVWWYGLLIALIVSLLSGGKVWWIIVPGGITCSLIARYRVGAFRYGLNYAMLSVVAISGPIASLAFGSLFKNLVLYTPLGLPIFNDIYKWNLVYCLFTLLPIPPLDGHYSFFGSRNLYVLTAGSLFVYVLLILSAKIYSWIYAFIGGVLIWIIYYILIEERG